MAGVLLRRMSKVARPSDIVRLGPRRLALLAEAALALAAARLALGLLPFRRIVRYLGAPVSVARDPSAPLPLPQRQRAREVAWALRAAAKRLPLDTACLTQALAGRALLRRRGLPATVHLGVARGLGRELPPIDTATVAHAWLESRGVRVSGYPVARSLIEVAAFS